ncbi:ADP-ribosyl-[dinitrogen reductase] glycohydrolase-like [Ylistrum balloti]|uniref:ADP-ribosyl-[dinitrogen reductase] glycohydrolase-like n=1 Tax=Ylistrum balloti TaxID=509963 RepID=UPI002905EDBC|nr:ADP-ribosyl-[dinitrogen reductase] glycohydrolase-like [Ylistrum balloti]
MASADAKTEDQRGPSVVTDSGVIQPTKPDSVTSSLDGDTSLLGKGSTSSTIDDAITKSECDVTSKTDGATSPLAEVAIPPLVEDLKTPPTDNSTDTPVDGTATSLNDGATLPQSNPEPTLPSLDGSKNTPARIPKKPVNVTNETVQRILGTIFGQCAGDAIGLLTEFLTKEECKEHYKTMRKELEFSHKIEDHHRVHWKTGDWTDDSDQMILILLSIVENQGTVDPFDFARRIKDWGLKGFPELGDHVGMGQGRTTHFVINKRTYLEDPFATAERVWDLNGRDVAANGAVMRTSILGVHMYADIDLVIQNAITITRTTHADPRCRASTVAVSVAIALMLQRQPKHLDRKGNYNIKAIIRDCYEYASKCLETDEKRKEFKTYLKCTRLKELKLDESGKIGYTYKTMGSGFWALKQQNFREAITKIIMEGGDADTNACVAGAMLGCKYGAEAIPTTWTQNLLHKEWLEAIIDRYFHMMAEVHNIDFTPYWTGHLL